MYLIILNGEVVGSHDDEPSEVAEGAELAYWEGEAPEARIIDGVVHWPLDPRDDPAKLTSVKKLKLKEIRAWDEGIRLAGVTIGSITLRYDDIGQQRIINLLAQTRELLEQGAITGDTLVVFEDANGDTIQKKVSVIKGAIQTYFAACQSQDEAVGDLMAQLKSATTVAEVVAIQVG
jgi:hypothetical protein